MKNINHDDLSMSYGIDNGIDGIENDTKGIENGIDGIENGIDGIDNDTNGIDGIDNDTNGIENGIDGIEKGIDNSEEKNAEKILLTFAIKSGILLLRNQNGRRIHGNINISQEYSH
ncbi:MAG: hypothetical protein FWG70_09025 [Oscillospiraceae bacterium]|nr:hypothetical protein [Oscillospiraceae bacterium]